jgi:hypothetical protein
VVGRDCEVVIDDALIGDAVRVWELVTRQLICVQLVYGILWAWIVPAFQIRSIMGDDDETCKKIRKAVRLLLHKLLYGIKIINFECSPSK